MAGPSTDCRSHAVAAVRQLNVQRVGRYLMNSLHLNLDPSGMGGSGSSDIKPHGCGVGGCFISITTTSEWSMSVCYEGSTKM